MGIPAPGQSLAPGLSTFSDDILKIELSGPSKEHLSIIDVPGIFRTPTHGVTTKEDMTLVQRMVKSYIKDSPHYYFSSHSSSRGHRNARDSQHG